MKVFLTLMLLGLFSVSAHADADAVKTEPFYFKTAAGVRHDLRIELADTDVKRQNGLMFRKSMDKDAGMLFVFPNEDVRVFWMRNTLISLDMIFINKAGVIVGIHENAKPLDETLIPSGVPASAVLEINGGRSAELGLKPGDIAYHPVFGNMLADEKPIQ